MILPYRRLAASALVLALTGCHPYMAPFPMPSGYTYQNSTPHSNPANYDKEFADESLALNAERAAHWQNAAQELAGQLLDEAGVPSVPVRVGPVRETTPHSAYFDHFLRGALRSRGVTLATAGAAPSDQEVRYSIVPVTPASSSDMRVATDAGVIPAETGWADAMEVQITLSLHAGGAVVASKTGTYAIRSEDRDFLRWPGFSTEPQTGIRTDQPEEYTVRD